MITPPTDTERDGSWRGLHGWWLRLAGREGYDAPRHFLEAAANRGHLHGLAAATVAEKLLSDFAAYTAATLPAAEAEKERRRVEALLLESWKWGMLPVVKLSGNWPKRGRTPKQRGRQPKKQGVNSGLVSLIGAVGVRTWARGAFSLSLRMPDSAMRTATKADCQFDGTVFRCRPKHRAYKTSNPVLAPMLWEYAQSLPEGASLAQCTTTRMIQLSCAEICAVMGWDARSLRPAQGTTTVAKKRRGRSLQVADRRAAEGLGAVRRRRHDEELENSIRKNGTTKKRGKGNARKAAEHPPDYATFFAFGEHLPKEP